MANTDLCRDGGGTIIPPDRDCTCEGIYRAIGEVLPDTPSESGQYALTANVDGDLTTIGWQSGGGGSSESIVPTFTYTAEGITCDMEFDQILHAVENGTCDHARFITTFGPSDNYDVLHLNHYDTYSPSKNIIFTHITWNYNSQDSSITRLQCNMLNLSKTGDNVEISNSVASHTF